MTNLGAEVRPQYTIVKDFGPQFGGLVHGRRGPRRLVTLYPHTGNVAMNAGTWLAFASLFGLAHVMVPSTGWVFPPQVNLSRNTLTGYTQMCAS